MDGVILKGIGGFYYVAAAGGQVYECKARGAFRKDGLTPLAGDRVSFASTGLRTASGEYEAGWIDEILPRRNCFDRPPCANIDAFVLVTASCDPAPSFPVIDRFLVAAEEHCAEVILAVSKTDAADEEIVSEYKARYEGLYPLVFTSAASGSGVGELKNLIHGKQIALAGASGVGKSTLSNALLGETVAKTGDISAKTLRGRNTTRHTELFQADDFSLFDTPGFTSLDVPEMEADRLCFCFPEFAPYLQKCRFSDCTHIVEQGCCVRQAVREGIINKKRYLSFKEMYLELKDRKQY